MSHGQLSPAQRVSVGIGYTVIMTMEKKVTMSADVILVVKYFLALFSFAEKVRRRRDGSRRRSRDPNNIRGRGSH